MEELPFGVLVLRDALDDVLQRTVLQACTSLRSPGSITPNNCPQQFTPYIYHNWPMSFQVPQTTAQPPGEPIHSSVPFFFELGENLHQIALDYALRHPRASNYCDQRKFSQEALYCIVYGPESVLESHQDIQGGWVISISVGASCEFFFSPKADGSSRSQIMLNSGDVVIFNGRRLFHGVGKVLTESVPKIWQEEWINHPSFASDEAKEESDEGRRRQFIRLNVQFRNFQSNLSA